MPIVLQDVPKPDVRSWQSRFGRCRSSWHRPLLILATLAFALASPVIGSARASGLYLVKDHRPSADIVIAASPTRAAKLGSRELQEYLRKMTGATLDITSTPGTDVAAHIFVGRSAYADAVIAPETLQKDSFRMRVQGNSLYLVGLDKDYQPPTSGVIGQSSNRLLAWQRVTGERWRSPEPSYSKLYSPALDIWVTDGVGSLNAVYEFLRGEGVEWYMPGEIGEVVPKKASVPLRECDRTVTFDFSRRRMTFVRFDSQSQDAKAVVLWYLRLGLGEDPSFWASHSMHLLLDGDREYKTSHPNYYALSGGKRLYDKGGHGVPCLSSEELFAATVRYARAYFDAFPEATMFPVMPPDGFVKMCDGACCRGRDAPDRGPDGILSDYVWSFVNRVAQEIAETHPGRMISCCAYSTYLLPPRQPARLGDNVVVVLCQTRRMFGDSETARLDRQIRAEWSAMIPAKRLYTWDYYLQSHHTRLTHGVPIVFPHMIATDLKSLRGVSRGEFVEGARTLEESIAQPGINHINYYITARFYLDASQDVDALLQRYYRDFFGPAGDSMKIFFDTAEAATARMSMPYDPSGFTLTELDRMLTSLKGAQGSAKEPIHLARVRTIADECEAKLATLRRDAAGTP